MRIRLLTLLLQARLLGSCLFQLCLVLLAVPQVVVSFVPPPMDSSTHASWEPVHTMRQRLGLEFNFTPSLLNPEMCRYLSEEECQTADQALVGHAKKMRNLPHEAGQRQRERQLQQQQEQEQEQQGQEHDQQFLRSFSNQSTSQQQKQQDQRELTPTLGVVKVLVILLQFTDHLDRPQIDPVVYDEMWNSQDVSDLIPSGSVARWFQQNSYGLYEIEGHIIPWTVASNTEEYYSFGSSGLTPDFQQAFWPALDLLDAQGMDWSQYDLDKDGRLDAVVMLHSGYAAELKGVDCNNDRDFSQRIWSHAYADSDNTWWSKDVSYRLGGYVVSSAYRDTCGFEPARIGTMTHEFMHTLGLVDLYDGQEARVGRGIGGFDIMATPYGPKEDPSWPGHLSAWSRIKVGWMMPIEIINDGVYSVQASELSNQAYAIRKPYPFMEYLLVENRQPIRFDARLWTGGLVIYHIDDRATLMVKRGYPGQEDWPRNGNHYQVAVLASDGQYSLEKGDNNGDMGDFWEPGMALGPGNGRVFPNTDAYQFGSIRVTGVTIDNIQKIDTVMTFRVTGLSPVPGPADVLEADGERVVWPTVAPLPEEVDMTIELGATNAKPSKISASDASHAIVGGSYLRTAATMGTLILVLCR